VQQNILNQQIHFFIKCISSPEALAYISSLKASALLTSQDLSTAFFT